MKTFPANFAAQKNLKTGAKPLWVLKLSVAGVSYYLSDNTCVIPPWGVTTKPWIRDWGTIKEGISGALEEYKISDFQLAMLADPDASPNVVDLVNDYVIEKDLCSLCLWMVGSTSAPQEMWRGYVRDYELTDGDTVCSFTFQDETLKWERSYVGKKVTQQDYPNADPDDVGKIMPLVYGSVSRLPALAVDAGVRTTLVNTINSQATSMVVSDASSLSVGMVLQVDSEQVVISAKAGDTLTVVRGANATLAAPHQRAAIVWEYKAAFFYVVAGKAVSQIPKAYCRVGQLVLDISAICTAWPAGTHPDYPGLAVIAVPGYITVEQAVSLAIADNTQVSNGTLTSALSGNVSRSGATALTGTVTLAGLVALLGSLLDPGHTHDTGQSSSEGTYTGLPTALPAATSGYFTQPTWGITGSPNIYYLFLAWPADGARTSVTYDITLMPRVTANNFTLWAAVNGVIRASYTLNVVNGSAFQFSFTVTGDVRAENVYILSTSHNTANWQITAATRQINLLVASTASTAMLNNTLSASNGTLSVQETLDILDNLVVDKGTLTALLAGSVAKTGTVALSGNSVANTLVGDQLLVDVTGNLTTPGAVIADILADWCQVASFRQLGDFPVGYAFDGAITAYRLALEVIHDLAWQCRSWFRHHLGEALLIVRTLAPAPVKTLAACRVLEGKKVHSRRRSEYGEVINTINLQYGRDWTQERGETAYRAVEPASDPDSIEAYGTQERPELFRFDMVKAQPMAADLVAFYLAYYADRHWLHSFETFYYDAELEFADAVTLAFAGGVAAQLEEVSFSPGGDVIRIKAVQ